MKKILAVMLALCALTASAFAAGSAEPAVDAASAATEAAESEKIIEAALTEEQALAAALKDAGEKEADVTVTKNKLTEKTLVSGEKVAVYSVKFETETTTYKYYVDGNTGAVLYKSIEFCSPDFALQSRSRSDEASAEPAEAASEETDAGSRRSRTGSRSASAEPAAEETQTDAVGA